MLRLPRAPRLLVVVLGALLILPALRDEAHAAKKLTRCQRTAVYFGRAKRLESLDGARRLRQLLDVDADCAEAPVAAYELLMKSWDEVAPTVDRALPRAVVENAWERFKRDAAFVQAIVAYRRSPIRAKAALSLGQLYEGMAVYLEQVGNGPDEMVVIREIPESLYHTRAVDLAEYLRIQAEGAYGLVVHILAKHPEDSDLATAREHLGLLAARFQQRAKRVEKEARDEGGEGEAPSTP